MLPRSHLTFNTHIGKQKPESIINRSTICPFCNREQLAGIVAEEGNILLVLNKYPVLEETLQTVLIETDDCDAELSTYSKKHLYQLFQFGFREWFRMRQNPEFRSVLFFKNHGPLSGGTIHHPHMQIVGLKYVDYRENVLEEQFDGLPIAKHMGVDFNVSTQPRVGFFEFNVVFREHLAITAEPSPELKTIADFVQIAVHFTLHHFHKNCNSYNLFFYELGDGVAVKIVPRFVTSPIFIGFSIPQVSNRIHEVVEEIKTLYFDMVSQSDMKNPL